MEVGCCPADSDETVEAYLLGKLPEEQSVAFEEHFLSCPRCSERLQFTHEFITAVHHVAERLRGTGVGAGT